MRKKLRVVAYKILEIGMPTYPTSLQLLEDFIDDSIRKSIDDDSDEDDKDDRVGRTEGSDAGSDRSI